MATKAPREVDEAAALARELADQLAAIATAPPGAAAAAAAAHPASAGKTTISLEGSRKLLEHGARFVTPVVPADARLFAAKKLFLRMLRVVTRDQTVFNSTLAEALRAALAEIEPALERIDAKSAHALEAGEAVRGGMSAAERRLVDAEVRLAGSEQRLAHAETRLAEAERDRASALEELSRVSGATNEMGARIGEQIAAVSAEIGGALSREEAARELLELDRDRRAEELARRLEKDAEGALRLSGEIGAVREELRQLKLEWTGVRRALREERAAPPPRDERDAPVRAAEGAAASTPAAADPLLAGIYLDFERRFRGSEDEIRARQRADAESFRGVPGPVADLGCGRGEFLELLSEAGIPASGCDANPLMVERARTKGLAVDGADLFDWLRARADGSLGGIAAYQVVEHLPPARLYDLVELCAAKLAPGGRVLFETINPESVFAMKWFWMDLTHVRPVPAPSLAQLLDAFGFRDVSVDLRSPVPDRDAIANPAGDPDLASIARLLYAPQDYAVTGYR